MTLGTPQLVAVLGRGIVATAEPIATGDDLGLTRGDGCFDAMRLVRKELDGRRSPTRSSRPPYLTQRCSLPSRDTSTSSWTPRSSAIWRATRSRAARQ